MEKLDNCMKDNESPWLMYRIKYNCHSAIDQFKNNTKIGGKSPQSPNTGVGYQGLLECRDAWICCYPQGCAGWSYIFSTNVSKCELIISEFQPVFRNITFEPVEVPIVVDNTTYVLAYAGSMTCPKISSPRSTYQEHWKFESESHELITTGVSTSEDCENVCLQKNV